MVWVPWFERSGFVIGIGFAWEGFCFLRIDRGCIARGIGGAKSLIRSLDTHLAVLAPL